MWDITLQTQPNPEKNFMKDCEQSLLHLKQKKIKRIIRQNEEEIKKFEELKDFDAVEKHLAAHIELKKMQSEISTQLNNVIIR